ncbi:MULTISPECIES: circadian clock protein KaiC [Ramlibacter]|uniref:non-specific serine/threonine protein kinase n=1 Tax=Ramlibacter pinisoli TaxID=2682844 RepID=A0A6N8IWC5_9BURK|nr:MULTISPECIES: circadian clock protein KaiC [Ramlibacter]MBA2961144.1 circadian clock protein KaiC [Ramlibacter sp. CGMCC 1.13660]MVQ31088.1 circadian clock protein KaiC [Ramlibacter pinisoli]
MVKPSPALPLSGLPKAPTGISGLDEITQGGLPRGRPTLVCGAAGCGKTMLAAEFIVRGATEFGEPGVFMMFEESEQELVANMRSLGFDLEKLQRQKKLALDYVRVERSEIEETGEYDLEGLFIRLGHAIDSIGAKRVVLDTVEALFASLPNQAILRAELRRLFRWLKDKGVTAVITGERGEGTLTRYGLEEYVADCVVLLDHRIVDQVSTRRLRVVKYRGSAHGTNEYPFLIGSRGLSVLPITSLRLDHQVSEKRVSTGIAGLDAMFGGQGVYRGSSVLVSGAPGTGKSSVAATFAHAACARGERALLFAYEESESQLLRNMRSIGIDLAPWLRKGQLQIHASRPTLHGLEQHLVHIYELVHEFKPSVVVVDPISNLSSDTHDAGLKLTLMRLIDFLKQQGVTALFTSLTVDTTVALAASEVGVSSLMDSWLLLTNIAYNGERTRTLQVLKSRGMHHSNQVREFVFSNHGVDLVDVYLSGDRVLTGTARVAQEAQELAATEMRTKDHDRRLRDLANQRKALDAQIAALNADAEQRAGDVEFAIARERFEAAGVAARAKEIAQAGSSRAPAPKPRKAGR